MEHNERPVAIVRQSGHDRLAVRTPREWIDECGDSWADEEVQRYGRPAAVVDYDSADDMERLSAIWHAQEAAVLDDDMRLSVAGWRLRQTLREFANQAGGHR